MELQLKGKRAIITGASRGIGRAIAERLAAEGAELAICARDGGELAAAALALRTSSPRVVASSLDVRDPDALRDFIGESTDALGGLDILVCNPTAFGGEDDDAWRGTFETDLMGAVRSVTEAREALARSSSGSVVFLGTTAAIETFAGPISYGPLKAALVVHAKELARALAPEGVRVNVVSPGPVFFPGGAWDHIREHQPAFYERVLDSCPQGRLGTPQEIAEVVAFLASPASSLMTGANLVVDGGFTKRVNF
ncbi:MAG TPA: SDR family oxidoreductase [Thermoleophilaceae bacterium]|nr:SDR family oxidoreductase [Thermoleophilaceae bacterium]